LTDLLKKNAFG
jgi:hypothetical protein